MSDKIKTAQDFIAKDFEERGYSYDDYTDLPKGQVERLMQAYGEYYHGEKVKDDSEMFDNMQYYMEHCKMNGYVTPQEWIEKHKHFNENK